MGAQRTIKLGYPYTLILLRLNRIICYLTASAAFAVGTHICMRFAANENKCDTSRISEVRSETGNPQTHCTPRFKPIVKLKKRTGLHIDSGERVPRGLRGGLYALRVTCNPGNSSSHTMSGPGDGLHGLHSVQDGLYFGARYPLCGRMTHMLPMIKHGP